MRGQDSNLRYLAYETKLEPAPVHPATKQTFFLQSWERITPLPPKRPYHKPQWLADFQDNPEAVSSNRDTVTAPHFQWGGHPLRFDVDDHGAGSSHHSYRPKATTVKLYLVQFFAC